MIYFLVYLFLEVTLTVEIASKIGGWATFVEIIGSALAGIFILSRFRHAIVEHMAALATQKISAEEFSQRNLSGLFGALLLILPGFLGDIIGILMQFGFLRSFMVNRFGTKFHSTPTQSKDDNVIDAEIIDNTPSLR